MTDLADAADRAIAIRLADALARRAPPGPAATGACLACGDLLAGDRRWCDAECRDWWERRQSTAPDRAPDRTDGPLARSGEAGGVQGPTAAGGRATGLK